jgi:hypothetical protein
MFMGAWSPWGDANYAWVVICKNKKFHRQTNLLYGHKIPLGEQVTLSRLDLDALALASVTVPIESTCALP